MTDEIELRDGSRILIRPIEPTERDALAEGHRRLCSESRYRRFFGPKRELTERDPDHLTRVDHHDHEALVAIEADTGGGVGVARYMRTGDDTPTPHDPEERTDDAFSRRGNRQAPPSRTAAARSLELCLHTT